MESIIVAAVTGGLALIGTLVGTYFANRKSAALIAYRLEELEKRADDAMYEAKNRGRNNYHIIWDE